jgi:hypothetical protein
VEANNSSSKPLGHGVADCRGLALVEADHAAALLSEQLTDYERYACDFGYRYNGEYEDIRILHRSEHEIPPDLIDRDFWIIGDAVVVRMHYGERGCFEGADVADSAELADYLRTRDVAWPAAEPFTQWWDRHPALHRKVMA